MLGIRGVQDGCVRVWEPVETTGMLLPGIFLMHHGGAHGLASSRLCLNTLLRVYMYPGCRTIVSVHP